MANDIIYNRRYADDILIIFDQNKTDGTTITHHMKSFHPNLEFTPTLEEHNSVNNLDSSLHKSPQTLQLSTHRKPTHPDTTIHFTSTHPLRQKLAAYHFYVNRMLTLPITNHAKLHEWSVICNIARNNGFPSQLIHNLRQKLTNKRKTQTRDTVNNNRNWVTFTFSNPLVHKITNLFKTPTLILPSERQILFITSYSIAQIANLPSRVGYINSNAGLVISHMWGSVVELSSLGIRNTLGTYVLTPPHQRMPFISSTTSTNTVH
jgi:hypothetical protein